LELEPLATHRLDEDRQLQFASPRNLEHLCGLRWTDLDAHISEHFLRQTVPQMPAREVLPGPARKRRRVDAEAHPNDGLVNLEPWQCCRELRVGDGVANLDIFEPRQDEEIATYDLLHFLTANATKSEKPRCTLTHRRTIPPDQRDHLTATERPGRNATDGQSAEIVGCVKVGDEGL
jgi:hypothetical protein